MTIDEFERIMTAACQMHTLNICNTGKSEIYVSLKGIMAIVQSQLHAEDRDKWVYDEAKFGWVKNPRCL